ncbi:uncharacterized protein F5147DRAFT_781034 [Suillus discolor]|uniref:Uncharacterized protein n=1 Tax=Suillus discolor TaxID=1912936 RepID=A0A9P7EU24_9AGAM|nr:uncharacterized protein F5147DRAFT_781034 [Suillus discolor]KAG2088398.1 hypothetical protein F5147DRAFT_781034 [Suillus discolor]
MEVIDIPSSPELLPTTSRVTRNQSQQPRSQKRRILPRPPPVPSLWAEEIIEITDSDSEPEYKPMSPEKRRSVKTHAVPGPSNLPVIGAPLDGLLEGAAIPAAGSSQKHLRKDRIASAPLFYSDDEDAELQQRSSSAHDRPMITLALPKVLKRLAVSGRPEDGLPVSHRLHNPSMDGGDCLSAEPQTFTPNISLSWQTLAPTSYSLTPAMSTSSHIDKY